MFSSLRFLLSKLPRTNKSSRTLRPTSPWDTSQSDLLNRICCGDSTAKRAADLHQHAHVFNPFKPAPAKAYSLTTGKLSTREQNTSTISCHHVDDVTRSGGPPENSRWITLATGSPSSQNLLLSQMFPRMQHAQPSSTFELRLQVPAPEVHPLRIVISTDLGIFYF